MPQHSCVTGYYVPFLLLPLYAIEVAEDDSSEMAAAFLLTILGISNTCGRVISGVLGTRKWVDSLILNNLALLIAGVITMLLPYCQHYFLLCMFAVVFGVCVGKCTRGYRIVRVHACVLQILSQSPMA